MLRVIQEKPGAGRLGRHVEHDERSRQYGVERHAGPLKAVKWKRHGQPLDQDLPTPLGSCTGNAIAGVLNTEPFYRAGAKLRTEDDAIRVYELATQLDAIQGAYPPDDTGSSGLAACKAAKRLGLISGYRHAFGITDALAALQRGPVITGVDWYEGFDTPDRDGMVRIAGQVRGGHEFEVLEFNPVTMHVAGENSWGPAYGLHGKFRFSVETWAMLLAAQGDVTIPVP